MRRRILSGMLALCLLLCLTPATVLAEESSEPANYSQVSNDGEDNPGIVVNANGGDEEILSDEENSVQPGAPAGEDGDTGAGDENVSQDPAQPDDQDGNDAGDQPGAPAGEDGDTGAGDENVPQDPAQPDDQDGNDAGGQPGAPAGEDATAGEGGENGPQDPAQSDEQDGNDAGGQPGTPAGEDDDAGEGGENGPQDPAQTGGQDGTDTNGLSAPAFFSTYTGQNEYDAANESQLEAAVEVANDAAKQATAAGTEIPQITIRLTADIQLNNGTQSGAYYSLTDGANVHLTSSGNYTLRFDNSHATSGVYFFEVKTDSSLTLSNITLDCNSVGQTNFKSGALYVNGAHLYIQDGARIINSNVHGYSSTVINLNGSTCVMSGGEISGHDNTNIPSSMAAVFRANCSSFTMAGGTICNNKLLQDTTWGRWGMGGIVGVVSTAVDKAASFTMTDGTISDNQVLKGYGGAITAGTGIAGSTTVLIENGTITRNSAINKFGGAISAITQEHGTAKVTINDGTISYNKALGGGAIYVRGAADAPSAESCSLTINGGTIANNKAKITDREDADPSKGPQAGEGGGAITVNVNATFNLNGGTIKENYSDLSGGAVQIAKDCRMYMYDGVIADNTAESHGGAICVAADFSVGENGNPEDSVLYMYGGTIQDNIAKSTWVVEKHDDDPYAPGGGGIFLHGNCQLYLYGPTDQYSGAKITGNETGNESCGGGVYGCFGSTILMNGGWIENNTAAHSGGGVYLDGVGSYEGYTHDFDSDDSYGTGARFRMYDGRIAGNTAKENGGGIYLSGENTISETQDGPLPNPLVFRGAVYAMSGGVITDNTAWDAGGGVYVESTKDQGEQAATFVMTDGALYFNVAGEKGGQPDNTSPDANDAGAELYAQGGKSQFTVPAAEAITAYIQDSTHTYVPDEDRAVWFTSWYDDYSDQDSQYGKGDSQTLQTARHTGRYMSSKTLDRMAYLPVSTDKAYRALILDRSTSLQLAKQVSGEDIRPGETYAFTLTVSNLPDLAVAGD
ncbi:hypothetical protein H6B10_00595 [Gemmiger formicilis]|uniref:hypothetical protein n=1 Tax=Gemmiger formicilis TaxID=745368 RepID=UPI00195BDD36|nr:hypothetical protein [Gemmiger formicilis]MBM6898214.1 hypothetical protein [Gemmiger formicilis]